MTESSLQPVSETAFYCCGTRMQDAESKKPLLNDQFAKVFMTEHGKRIFSRFKLEIVANAACVVRHFIIDKIILEQLQKNVDSQFVIIGAGFDTRAYRMQGGTWLECDEEQVILFKNAQLPLSDCPNTLHRLPIDFSSNSLEETLRKFNTNKPVMVILEGVSMYLPEKELIALIDVLQRCFPRHQLVCDLATARFLRYFGTTMHRKIKRLGSSFRQIEKPQALFLNRHYDVLSTTSIVGKLAETHVIKIPELPLKYCLPVINNGYAIHVFQTNDRKSN